MKTRLIALGLLCAANLAHADLSGKGRERKENYIPDTVWQEQVLPLPAYGQADWVELDKPVTLRQRLFIDRRTLLLAEDRTVRFSLRQLSASGVDNISHEGLHCGERTQRSFAFGDSVNQRWIASSRSSWRKLERNSEPWATVVQALCPEKAPPLSQQQLNDSLTQAAVNAPRQVDPGQKQR